MSKEEVYIDRISREEFEVLYGVGIWNFTTLDYIKGISEELGVNYEKVNEILLSLESKKLLTIMYRDKKIYAAELTEKGKLLFHHEEYREYKEELGY